MGVLTDSGFLDAEGNLTQGTRDDFITDVKFLVETGASDDFWIIPLAVDFPLNPLGSPAPGLENEEQFPIFHKIWLDTLLQGTAKVLDVGDATPLAATGVIDPCALAFKLGLPIPDIDFDVALGLFPLPDIDFVFELLGIDPLDIPDLILKLPELVVPSLPNIDLPELPSLDLFIPIPTLPSLSIPFPPSLPLIPFPKFPALPTFKFPVLPSINIVLGCLFTAIPIAFLKLVDPLEAPNTVEAIAEGPLGIVKLVAEAVVGAIATCLGGLGLNLGALLAMIAAIIVYIKFLIIMLVVVIISQILGFGCLALGLKAFLVG